MNVKDRLLHIANLNNKYRAHGLTTELVKAAKELHAIYLVHSFDEAKRLTHLHRGLTVKSIDINLDGFAGPFIVDHHALDILLQRAANKIEELEAGHNKLVQAHKKEVNGLQQEVEFLTNEGIQRGIKISRQIEEINDLKSKLNLKYILKLELKKLWERYGF